MKSRNLILLCLAWTFLVPLAFIPSIAHAALNCTALQAQLLAMSDITAASSAIQPPAPASGPPPFGTPAILKAYCEVNITVSDLAGPENGYQPGQKQQIKIRIGLPLNSSDGGTGGFEGNWNGKIQDLGGGGYAGSVGFVMGAHDDD